LDKKSRLVDIDRAKGFAIFLVVLGHIVATDMPVGNEWYAVLKFYIYKFHMPFFMFISGIIMAYTFPVIKNMEGYILYVFKKIKRLAPGYLLFGVLIYAGKVYMSKLIHVDDVPGNLYTELYNLLIIPSKSAGGSLWFIYVLMEMYMVFPLFIMAFSQKPMVAVFTGGLLMFLPVTSAFMLDRFCEYFMFFAIGVMVVNYYEGYLNLVERFFYVFFILFCFSFLSVIYLSAEVSKAIIGLFSLPALQGLMRVGPFSNIPIWAVLGKYTYSIYLMNTIVIGMVKGGILTNFSWDGANFWVIAPVLLLVGVYGPIIIKKHVLSKSTILDRITS